MAVISNGGKRKRPRVPVPRAPLPPRPTYTPPPDAPVVRFTGATTPAVPTVAPVVRFTGDTTARTPTYTHEETRLAQYDRGVPTTPVESVAPTSINVASMLAGIQPTVPTAASRFVDPRLGPMPPSETQIQDPYLRTLSQLGISLPETYTHEEFRLTQYDRTIPGGRGGEYDYADYPVALATRSVFGLGVLPESLSTDIASQMPWDQFGYSSTDQFLTDLGYYYDDAAGHWRLGDPGGDGFVAGDGTRDGGARTGATSYQRATTGTGYTGRYAGASTGLINWRIGF